MSKWCERTSKLTRVAQYLHQDSCLFWTIVPTGNRPTVRPSFFVHLTVHLSVHSTVHLSVRSIILERYERPNMVTSFITLIRVCIAVHRCIPPPVYVFMLSTLSSDQQVFLVCNLYLLRFCLFFLLISSL